MQKKRRINLIFIHIILFLGSLISITTLYFMPDFWITICLVFAANVIFCVSYLMYDKRTKKSLIYLERERAVVAENYIAELQEYVASQDEVNKSLKESKEKFRHAAFHDVLTGLPNRNLFIETLKFILEKHKQTPNFNFAVFSLDLNSFKTIKGLRDLRVQFRSAVAVWSNDKFTTRPVLVNRPSNFKGLKNASKALIGAPVVKFVIIKP